MQPVFTRSALPASQRGVRLPAEQHNAAEGPAEADHTRAGHAEERCEEDLPGAGRGLPPLVSLGLPTVLI